jgi:hypothetical protein
MRTEELGKPLHPEAERLLRDYRNRLERALERCRLRDSERLEIRREIESHLYERLRRVDRDRVEPSHVLDILYKLGDPEGYVPLYLTQSDLSRGLHGSLRHLLRGYGRWLRATVVQHLLSLPFVLCYLLSLLLILGGLLKLLFPEDFRVYAIAPASAAAAQAEIGKETERERGRPYLSFGFSFSVPGLSSPSSAASSRPSLLDTERRRELLSPLGAIGLLTLGLGIALLATWLLRRLLRGLLLRQYGI